MIENNQLKIVFSLASFYPTHRAGTETYVLNLSKELMKLGYKISVIIPAIGKTSENYTYEGIKVYSFSVPLKIGANEMNGLVAPSGITEFKKLLQKIKPDIFHLHSLSRSIHAEHLQIANEMGIYTAFTAHLGGSFCIKGNFRLFGEKLCDGKIAVLRCLSCFIREKSGKSKFLSKLAASIIYKWILKSPLKKIFPAYNISKYKQKQIEQLKTHCSINIAIAKWLETVYKINGLKNTTYVGQAISNDFKRLKTKKNVCKGRIQLIFIGRMTPLKNVEIIFEAIRDIKEYFNIIIITIPNKDELNYHKQIKSEFSALNYTDWFENMRHNEIEDKLEQADLLILPSKYEVAPLVILEAFAKKKPVIGSDYIAIKEMIQHNVCGLLFENGNAESLKNQIQRIIDEPELINKLSKNIEEVRTFEDVAREHDKLYKILVNQ